MADYTPPPWRTGRKVFRTIYGPPDFSAPEGRLIGVMDRPDDAARVVRAVNCHHDLVEALAIARDGLRWGCTDRDSSMAINIIEAALAKADGHGKPQPPAPEPTS